MKNYKKIITRIYKIFIFTMILSSFCFIGVSQSQETAETDTTIVVMKQVQGEVSGISRNFIAVIYAQDENASYEIALAMDKDTKVEGAKKLKEIKVGDIVSVNYEDKAEIVEENVLISRLAKVVTLITSAPQISE